MQTSTHLPVTMLKCAQKPSEGDARRHKIAGKIPQMPVIVKKALCFSLSNPQLRRQIITLKVRKFENWKIQIWKRATFSERLRIVLKSYCHGTLKRPRPWRDSKQGQEFTWLRRTSSVAVNATAIPYLHLIFLSILGAYTMHVAWYLNLSNTIFLLFWRSIAEAWLDPKLKLRQADLISVLIFYRPERGIKPLLSISVQSSKGKLWNYFYGF